VQQIRKRLTYANVMSSIAVFLVLGGAAFAATKLPKNSVGTKQLKKNAVTTQKIKKGAVTGAKVKVSSLPKVPSATNADHASNADTVGGLSASAFLASNGVRADGAGVAQYIDDFQTESFTDIVSKSFTAPSNGFIYVTGSLTTEADNTLGGEGELQFRIALDGSSPTSINDYAHQIDTNTANGVESASGSTTVVLPVSAGNHTASLQAQEIGEGDFIEGREISVLFVPNGSASSTPYPCSEC
jgi:hypothetical protein